jgi:hypothetical protein
VFPGLSGVGSGQGLVSGWSAVNRQWSEKRAELSLVRGGMTSRNGIKGLGEEVRLLSYSLLGLKVWAISNNLASSLSKTSSSC